MIVKLFDRTELVVSSEIGDKLKQSLAKSSDGMVAINEYFIKKSAIAYIKPGGRGETDIRAPIDSSRRLRADSRSLDEIHRAARKASDVARENLRKKGLKL